jgi:hypothetical protein
VERNGERYSRKLNFLSCGPNLTSDRNHNRVLHLTVKQPSETFSSYYELSPQLPPDENWWILQPFIIFSLRDGAFCISVYQQPSDWLNFSYLRNKNHNSQFTTFTTHPNVDFHGRFLQLHLINWIPFCVVFGIVFDLQFPRFL